MTTNTNDEECTSTGFMCKIELNMGSHFERRLLNRNDLGTQLSALLASSTGARFPLPAQDPQLRMDIATCFESLYISIRIIYIYIYVCVCVCYLYRVNQWILVSFVAFSSVESGSWLLELFPEAFV